MEKKTRSWLHGQKPTLIRKRMPSLEHLRSPYLNAYFISYDKPTRWINSQKGKLQDAANQSYGKEKNAIHIQIRVLDELLNARAGKPSTYRAYLLTILSQYDVITVNLISRMLKVKEPTILRELNNLQKMEHLPPKLNKKIARIKKKGNPAHQALRSGLRRKKVLQYIMSHSPRTYKEIQKNTGVGMGNLIKYMQDWTKSEKSIRNAQEGTGKDIEQKLQRITSRYRREPTYLFTEQEKLDFVFGEAMQKKIKMWVRNALMSKDRALAKDFIEKKLLRDLDYLPSVEGLDWYVETRLAYGILNIYEMQSTKAAQKKEHGAILERKLKTEKEGIDS